MEKKEYAFVKAIFEWAEMFAVSICIVIVVMTLVVRHSPVSGHSMYPTLRGTAVRMSGNMVDSFAAEPGKNDILLISNLFYTPKSGDIVVTQHESDMTEPLVKRIIATPGQSLSIDFETWTVTVDGKILDESYVHREDSFMLSANFYEVMSVCSRTEDGSYIIPDGYLFCMGDNRNHSSDSRSSSVGLIDERYVIGRVIFRIFPFDRIGTVK